MRHPLFFICKLCRVNNRKSHYFPTPVTIFKSQQRINLSPTLLLFHPTDTLTTTPFLDSFHKRYGYYLSVAVADAGYGSEENYRFMEESGMEAYVKYNCVHIVNRPRYTLNFSIKTSNLRKNFAQFSQGKKRGCIRNQILVHPL